MPYYSEYDGESLLVPSELRGYRCWRLTADDDYADNLQLYPIYADLSPAWLAKKRSVAGCDRSLRGTIDHFGAPPSRACDCGFYATYLPRLYAGHLPRVWESYGGKRRAFIHGSILASGRTILGTKGFRTQYARVEALFGWRARRIAEYYGVPWYLTHGKFLKAHPPQDVSAFLGETKDRGSRR